MPAVPASRSSFLRLRHVLHTPQRTSGFGTATRPSTTNTPRAARLYSNLGRERLYLAKELGSTQRVTDEMADRVHRVTMFKIADEAQRKRLIEQYQVLGSSHKKDGKPYILSMVVGPAMDDPRSQGFTLVAKTEFASLEDMRYYDDECAAHGALKTFVKENLTVDGVMSVYFKPEAVASL
ncbi:stress responsive A/B Barrel domain-containing protein [Colletotrichum musicola]|uniref:Stress responsive A/B Barrel domain-containing protein n=1 Tax=Colletotrichum musicola TaxID=2175873 RepID=A0A8H6MRT0_9PEZI|nr:stress responsive A/B Barrel domain-containing protein [Colletotrichum musicola]